MNVFEAVEESVTTEQAARFYGLKVNRNGMTRCPFHDDRYPSMKVDQRFHCFLYGTVEDQAALTKDKKEEVKQLKKRIAGMKVKFYGTKKENTDVGRTGRSESTRRRRDAEVAKSDQTYKE